MLDNLEQKEGVNGIQSPIVPREDLNASARWQVLVFVVNLHAQFRHGRHARRICVVDEHGHSKVSVRKHGRYVREMHPNLVTALRIVRIVRGNFNGPAVLRQSEVVRRLCGGESHCFVPALHHLAMRLGFGRLLCVGYAGQ